MSSASSTTPDGTQESGFDLPGYTLPLDFRPPSPPHGDGKDVMTYRNALIQEHVMDLAIDRFFTDREVTMLRIINRITEIPGWETQVPDANLVTEWLDKYKLEDETSSDTTQQNVAAEYLFSDIILPEDVTNEESGQHSQHSTEVEGVTSRMKQCMINELQHRAEHFKRTNAVMVFDACVKSDSVISSDLRKALVSTAHALEETQAVQESEESEFSRQVDIVDPNCFPLIYGRTKVLTDRQIGLQDCIQLAGAGKTLTMRSMDLDERPWYDVKYQQLPCDVSLLENKCRIVSYINNVHPAHHQRLYSVIEDILTRAMPLLNETLTYHEAPLRIDLPRNLEESADLEGFQDVIQEDPGFCKWEHSRGAEIPEPLSFEGRNPVCGDDEAADSLQAKLRERGLQVIVRIESIKLTPAESEMEEGEWRLEGQPNEHICATAAYCYEAQNVTVQTFNFRQRFDFTDMFDNENHYGETWIEYMWAIFSDMVESNVPGNMTVTQELGPVPFPPGRLLTFPNVFQRRRSGLSLVDKSKPGYCKTLFLYLVDPHIRIISTANVPPLREDWFQNRPAFIDWFLRSRLPVELMLMIEGELGEEMDPPITLAEGQDLRDSMISSREELTERHNYLFEHDHLPGF